LDVSQGPKSLPRLGLKTEMDMTVIRTGDEYLKHKLSDHIDIYND